MWETSILTTLPRLLWCYQTETDVFLQHYTITRESARILVSNTPLPLSTNNPYNYIAVMSAVCHAWYNNCKDLVSIKTLGVRHIVIASVSNSNEFLQYYCLNSLCDSHFKVCFITCKHKKILTLLFFSPVENQ